MGKMADFLTYPYRSLTPPPGTAMALQGAYLVLMVVGVFSAYTHDLESIDTGFALAASVFLTFGGVVGWLSQYKALWFLERGAIFMVWGGALARSITVARVDDLSPAEAVVRVGWILVVCALLIPRYRHIRGADQDPKR